MEYINRALDGTVRYFEATQKTTSPTPDPLSMMHMWLLMIQNTNAQLAQNIFEDVEAVRLLLSRGGRPLPPLPADFFTETLLLSLEAHNKELVALQSVLETMDDDPKAQKLLADSWKTLVSATRRDNALVG